MDNLTKEQRHKNMVAIKSKNTQIETMLCKALWHRGVRYRKNTKTVYGTPDICIKKYKIAIFCDGDFWHGKNHTNKEFSTNKQYWDNKIKRNKERDLEVTITLRDKGWTVFRFWEDEILSDLEGCITKIMQIYKK
jgi:DNA mismatch endonuclease (patch repair protein)